MESSQTPVHVPNLGTRLLVCEVRVGEHGYLQQVGNSSSSLFTSMYVLVRKIIKYIFPKEAYVALVENVILPVLFSLDASQNLKHSLNENCSETLFFSFNNNYY